MCITFSTYMLNFQWFKLNVVHQKRVESTLEQAVSLVVKISRVHFGEAGFIPSFMSVQTLGPVVMAGVIGFHMVDVY